MTLDPLYGFAALPAVALGINVFNAVVWPRGKPVCNDHDVVVLIPARNEERGIEKAVRSVFASGTAVRELIVYDDGSTDQTPAILTRLGQEFPNLRVVQGNGLPSGWVGKPHACHQLARASQGDSDDTVLLFLDADVEVEPGGISRILSLMDAKGADLVTAVPRQVTGSFVERQILPLLHVTYTSWLPMPLVWLSHDPRFLAANGQVLAVRRGVYDAVGGFEAVKTDVVDDMAFCRRVKEAKRRVVFADGHHIARCRMYTDARGVWEGFSKNLYEGIGGHPVALLGVIGLYMATYVLPYLLLIASLGYAPLVGPAAVGVACNVGMRALLAAKHGHPVESVVFHPLAVLGLLAIAVNSWRWNRRGAIVWAGRTYSAKVSR